MLNSPHRNPAPGTGLRHAGLAFDFLPVDVIDRYAIAMIQRRSRRGLLNKLPPAFCTQRRGRASGRESAPDANPPPCKLRTCHQSPTSPQCATSGMICRLSSSVPVKASL
jgi:hypothetical protein